MRAMSPDKSTAAPAAAVNRNVVGDAQLEPITKNSLAPMSIRREAVRRETSAARGFRKEVGRDPI